MSDDMARNMEFIVQQQAQFAANIQKLDEAREAAEKRMTRLEGALVGLVEIIGSAEKHTNAKMAELADAQTRTSAKVDELTEKLDNLILVVERSISERHNGEHPPQA